MSTNSVNSINKLLSKFEPITLEQMDDVSFLKRTDTKFVFHQKQLESILNGFPNYYRLLMVNDSGIQDYNTIYFDTPLFEMYNQHHNGLRKRFKIRTRQYINSNDFFLEVKVKNNKGITSKKRIKMDNLKLNSLAQDSNFIIKKTPFSQNDLHETIKNQFSRITFVNEITPERITIDWQLSYKNLKNEKEIAMPNVCILEIKRDSNSKNPELDELLKKHQLYPNKFSKYCIGVSQLEPLLKNNRFKPVFQTLIKKEIIN